MKKMLVLFLATLLLITCGCGVSNTSEQVMPKAVNVLFEPGYLPQELLERFTSETGIIVQCYALGETEELIGKLNTGVSPFDLIFAESVILEQVASEGDFLQEIDETRLTNADVILPEAISQMPEAVRGSILPYLRTCVVLLNDVSRTQAPMTGYQSLWSPRFAGKVNVPADAHLMTAIALKTSGYDINANEQAQLNAAREKMCALSANTFSYGTTDTWKEVVANRGGASVAWAKDAQLAKEKNPKLEVLYPSEGAIAKMTCFAIPKSAPHKDAAYALLDYLLKGESCAAVSESVRQESLHKDIAAYTDVVYAESMAVRIAEKYTADTQYLHYVTPKDTYRAIWSAFTRIVKDAQKEE